MKPPRRIQVEVEPLSESRWRKLDAAVTNAIDAGETRPSYRPAPGLSRRRIAIAVAGFAGLAAAAAVGLWLRSPSPTPPPPPPLASVPAHVETGAKHTFVPLGLPGSASMDVGPDSVVTATGDDAHGIVLVLERGSVECEVAPRNDRPPFVVQSGDVRVRVVGTHFVVRRDAEATSVAVTHGTVEVTHDGATSLVHDGEAWPPLLVPPAGPVAPSAATPSVTAPPPPPVPAGPTDQQLYEQAARLEARDPDAATAIYQRLAAKSGGAWNANALFAAGRLSAERHHTAEARRLLEDYLARYPRGANTEDARALLAGLR